MVVTWRPGGAHGGAVSQTEQRKQQLAAERQRAKDQQEADLAKQRLFLEAIAASQQQTTDANMRSLTFTDAAHRFHGALALAVGAQNPAQLMAQLGGAAPPMLALTTALSAADPASQTAAAPVPALGASAAMLALHAAPAADPQPAEVPLAAAPPSPAPGPDCAACGPGQSPTGRFCCHCGRPL